MTFSTKRILSARFSRSAHHDTSGFTLTELLIVIAIAAVVAAVAVPSFKTTSRNMAVRGAANELISGIQFARSEAIRINQTVSLTLNGRTWQVFVDTNGNNIRDSNEALLREGTYSELINDQSAALSFGFAPTGMITSPTGAFPTDICLKVADDPLVQRRILFPTRATSPVIQAAGCP